MATLKASQIKEAIAMQETNLQWFKMYGDWATRSKIQMMSEVDQRRHAMLLSLRLAGEVPADDDSVAFAMRVTLDSWLKTKAELLKRNLCSANNDVPNWEKRQQRTKTSAERTREYRKKKKQACDVTCNDSDVTVTSQECHKNVTVTNGDNTHDCHSDALDKIRQDKNRLEEKEDSCRLPVTENNQKPKSKTKTHGTPKQIQAVIDEWNVTADAQGWKKSRGLEADRKKLRTAYKRREWREGLDNEKGHAWLDRLEKLRELGLPFVGAPGTHEDWVPNIEWFCREKTTRAIIEESYWENGLQVVNPDAYRHCTCGYYVVTNQMCSQCGKVATEDLELWPEVENLEYQQAWKAEYLKAAKQ